MSQIKRMTVACAAFAVLAMGAGRAHAVDMPSLAAGVGTQTFVTGTPPIQVTSYQAKAKAKVTAGGANKAVSVNWKIEVKKNGTVHETLTGTIGGTTNAQGVWEDDSGWQPLNPLIAPGGAPLPKPWTIVVTLNGTCGGKALVEATATTEFP